MSTRLRQALLRVLSKAGVRSFVARSGLGHHFVCHLGDFAGENPFYNREAFRVELELCASWLRDEPNPQVLDVGANVGFWSTHLVQMIPSRSPEVFAFEPVPETVVKLMYAVARLGLGKQVHVVPAAVGRNALPVRLRAYSPRESLFAQVEKSGLNRRVGDRVVYAAGITLDDFVASIGSAPSLVKIDVEGSEIDVLLGAKELLQRTDRPALMLEYNPQTLSEMGARRTLFAELLGGYQIYYVDDFSGQLRPVGAPVSSFEEIDWVCNLFAVPSVDDNSARWVRVLSATRLRLGLVEDPSDTISLMGRAT